MGPGMTKLDGSLIATINRNSPVPLYSQIRDVLLELIKDGSFQEKELIPTERELGQHFRVSRITVRRAIDELAREGYLVTHQGKGTFVNRTKIHRPMNRMNSFSEATVEVGRKPGSRLLSLRHQQVDQHIAPLLQLNEQDWIWVVERLRLADDEPLGLSHVYLTLPLHLTLTPLELNQEISLWTLLEKKGIKLTHTEQTIQAVPATGTQADLLDVPVGFPLLLVEGVVYADGHQPVEFHQIFNRGDRYKYTVYAER